MTTSAPLPTADLQLFMDNLALKHNTSFAVGLKGQAEQHAFSAGIADQSTRTKAKPEDAYVWGSVTKTFTGASIMQLVAHKKLALDDRAAQYIDPVLRRANYPYPTLVEVFSPDRWMVSPAITFNASEITIRHLLSMRSGVEDYDTDACEHPTTPHSPPPLQTGLRLRSAPAVQAPDCRLLAVGYSRLRARPAYVQTRWCVRTRTSCGTRMVHTCGTRRSYSSQAGAA